MNRYCWSKDQWATLLSDAMAVVGGTKEKHSLGRITCVIGSADDGAVVVIDGQQRNTTSVLLLAAIRDVCHDRASDAVAASLEARLDGVLFPDGAALADWSTSRRSATADATVEVGEGEALRFASLVPTYCDRSPFFAAILPRSLSVRHLGGWHRPFEAKQFFLSKAHELSTEQLTSLTDVVLNKLEWLFFPIDMSGDHQDGTEDLQVIFERTRLAC